MTALASEEVLRALDATVLSDIFSSDSGAEFMISEICDSTQIPNLLALSRTVDVSEAQKRVGP